LTPELRTSDFDYNLPPELVAQEPLPERSDSRLLAILRTGRGSELPGRRTPVGSAELVDSSFAELPRVIPSGDLLVLNTTRVRHARLLATRPSGASAEVLLIRPAGPDTWLAMGRPGSALRPGKRVALGPDAAIETLAVLEDGNRLVRFSGITAEHAIERYGRLPLPPYIHRDPTELDEQRYQTVYARREGSVAAPTAGLHFTPEILDRLAECGVVIQGLELEVGPGTFKPVESDDPRKHALHAEQYHIPEDLANAVARLRAEGRDLWAVGTTVVRALESAAAEDRTVRPGSGETRLMIMPGYRFRVVDHVLTNFHLPRSTLLMLVSAFAGYELMMAAYRHAVAERYRFYSYGDAMVII
jgi:S-adenosylmethionine:tRNA ribosyltransferase-isomerase